MSKELIEKISPETLKEAFGFLNALRETGKINMLLGAQYLEREFGFKPREAKAVLLEWAKSFGRGQAVA